jgi:hypothetical protein
MFDGLGPENPPLPPTGALEQATTRGRKLRRQRVAGLIVALALSALLISGFALAGPFRSDHALLDPAGPASVALEYAPVPALP